MTDKTFMQLCKDKVWEYVDDHLDKSDGVPYYEVYIVWYCKTLQNWKALASTTLNDGMYYELTLNGDKQELYLDAYKKFENKCIKLGKSEEQESILDKIKEEIRDNTYFINEINEKEGIDFETVEKIIDKYKAESEDK